MIDAGAILEPGMVPLEMADQQGKTAEGTEIVRLLGTAIDSGGFTVAPALRLCLSAGSLPPVGAPLGRAPGDREILGQAASESARGHASS
jgi:hypothetical protein